jgi:uncharacterized protein YutE (UPF0331/DUF86 family)
VSNPKEQQAKAKEVVAKLTKDIVRVEAVITTLNASLTLLQTADQREADIADCIYEAAGNRLHGFYTGVETMLSHIIKFKTGQLPSGPESHKELLLKAEEEKIIDPEQHSFLRRLGGLRHVVRHNYGIRFEPEILKSTATETISQWPGIKEAILRQINEIGSGGNS